MSKILEASFEFTMAIEGGYFDDPAGGPTKYGVSLKAHAQDIGDRDGDGDIDADDVKLLEKEDAMKLFAEKYFRGDLPAPIALMYADMAYHHGAVRAVKLLQTACNALGVPSGAADGKIGPKTRRAIQNASTALPEAFLAEVQRHRLRFMRGLPNWEPNQNGWERRCFLCALAAKELV